MQGFHYKPDTGQIDCHEDFVHLVFPSKKSFLWLVIQEVKYEKKKKKKFVHLW